MRLVENTLDLIGMGKQIVLGLVFFWSSFGAWLVCTRSLVVTKHAIYITKLYVCFLKDLLVVYP